ncbi:hypothetical protein OF83DRAFT_47025 [Amylostereum chailletii]|nr:hypothetical protein OF83DRAFT_47025 [Amylostereum chailletii]
MLPDTYNHPEKRTRIEEQFWGGTECANWNVLPDSDTVADDLHVSLVYYHHTQPEPDGRHIDGYAALAQYRDEDCVAHITSANSKTRYALHVVGPGRSPGPVGGPQSIELQWETALFVGAIHRYNIPYGRHPLDWFAHYVSKISMPRGRAHTADATMEWLEVVIHNLRRKGAILELMYQRLLAENIFRKPKDVHTRMERGVKSLSQSMALVSGWIPRLLCGPFSSELQSSRRSLGEDDLGRLGSTLTPAPTNNP